MKLPEDLALIKKCIQTEMQDKRLSISEIAVLRMLASGYSNKEAADQLVLSAKTVEKHRSNIYAKLSIHNVVDLTHYAICNGLVAVKQFNRE